MMSSFKFSLALIILLLIHHKASAQQEMRIVSAGGSITEILYALGMASQIVATDTSSSFPQAVKNLPKVGYYRQLSTEGVLKMMPTHVFAVKGVGPEAVLKQLKIMGVSLHVFEHDSSVKGLQQLVAQIGERVGRESSAQQLNAQIQQQLAVLPTINKAHKPIFLMSVNERGLMAAGSNTVPDLLFNMLTLGNPFASFDGFKPISTESLLASGASMIFLPQHQTRGMSVHSLCQLPALSSWAKIYGCNVHIVDSLLFLGLTPRLPEAAKQIAQTINAASAPFYN